MFPVVFEPQKTEFGWQLQSRMEHHTSNQLFAEAKLETAHALYSNGRLYRQLHLLVYTISATFSHTYIQQLRLMANVVRVQVTTDATRTYSS